MREKPGTLPVTCAFGGQAWDEGQGVESKWKGQAQGADLSYLNVTQEYSTQSLIFII